MGAPSDSHLGCQNENRCVTPLKPDFCELWGMNAQGVHGGLVIGKPIWECKCETAVTASTPSAIGGLTS
jgi:hypothetical protein